MKKFMLLSALCVLALFVMAGCSSEPVVYQEVAGNLEQLDTKTVCMQTVDGQALCFELAPESLVYQGDALHPGDEIKVVYEGSLEGTDTKGLSVIAVSANEQ